MSPVQQTRRRVALDVPGAPCQLCRGATVVTESRAVRRSVDWLNPRWHPDVRVYELCQSCGAKHRLGRDAG